MKKNIIQLAIPTPLRRSFDYLHETVLPIGSRVQAPFGRRSVVGIVTAHLHKSDFPIDKLKSISAVIDQTPLIDEKLLALYQWASDYYHHPLGDVLLGTLPKKIRDGKNIVVAENNSPSAIEKPLPDFALTFEQITAIETIQRTKTFQTFLLAGVTGSGKTEVYLRAIAEVLKKQQQALVLVPEIALTPQTVQRFEARFSVPVLALHSGLTDKKRSDAWMSATHETPCIVIGTRSAVFAPLRKLGIIIVDEEHDISFKQQSGFRYSARDVAVMRAKMNDIPVVLGSATPSLESIRNTNEKKYFLLILPDRTGIATQPTVTLHNIRNEILQQGLSPALIECMHHHLKKNQQVLLFLNRRGFAPVALCHQCGWSAMCQHCDARMTVHENPKRFICHHCGYLEKWVRTCQSCQQSELTLMGVGTEQLETVLTTLFPDKNICRIDRDQVKTFTQLEKKLKAVHEGTADIIVGTQMIVKGHHFENVTLVAAIDVDQALFSGDFRATERLGQSLLQVAGRAGRAEKPGEVFIQTHEPHHPLLEILFSKTYFDFANLILAERKLAKLPPFVPMASIRAEGKQKETVIAFLHAAKQAIKKIPISISDPVPATMEKKAGVYRAFLFLQSAQRQCLNQALSQFILFIDKRKSHGRSVRFVIDVDPMEFG
ncbi:MAG: hypothetical protein A3I77_00775 [Gammaproteobacteria bacterium RIFCSPLOWO2_02_FULL_42_14]|nr:MAG: hypothetical protein A3B71_04565 [Gammaproteobacteria bacterium RIFCSPHIGHO2_02_FULL_42_43]OGT53165.1 MAG: hypothetical protein A3E54_08425 [Gammaproteobacteria bacterium RIFCSPHIGHO2_12_FULL_41_25]OGT61006.1 MAG: hypothetical protein A3I77_00775 [Gammaproteobacteria bacterium RIFCSPLOWO2_02_FULL_42_14]OGT85322.1 MAG: hypothetical protein A3G86_05410 [Gammaproteobacteria bacterium RIFCSPLOWO2_12_FULL_42_18]